MSTEEQEFNEFMQDVSEKSAFLYKKYNQLSENVLPKVNLDFFRKAYKVV